MSDKKVKMTENQEDAIFASGGGVTVSAAAGSGKTWVLVEKVIHLLIDEKIPADRLLVLTFTKTAAAEMKKRISDRLEALIDKEPYNDFYRHQQMLLQMADICTIDTFCSKVVRENYYQLGVNRDFKIETGAGLIELRRKLMTELIESSYDRAENDEEYGKAFGLLSMMLTSEKLDSDLENELLGAYDKYISHAFPELWLKESIAIYDPESDLSEKGIIKLYSDTARDKLLIVRHYYERAAALFKKGRPEMEASFEGITDKKELKKIGTKRKNLDTLDNGIKVFGEYIKKAEELLSAESPDLNDISTVITEMFDKTKISVRLGTPYTTEINAAMQNYKAAREIVQNDLKTYLCYTNEMVIENNNKLYPVIKCLGEMMKEFQEKFFAEKCERGILDFHDLEALVLKLLYSFDEGTGEYKRTDFGEQLSKHYDQIMVDEYQDTNDIQEKIFKAISRNEENLFVVGDIKQSIFRFREAKPVLFRNRCEKSTIYDRKEKKFPALIILDRNFRSRVDVIESVNYIFGLLMSKKSAEIDYDHTQALTAGAEYPQNGEDNVQLHIIDYNEEEVEAGEEDISLVKNEAAYCAMLIEKMMKESTVYDKEKKTMRKPVYSDFCILMRAVKDRANIYARELEKRNIPAYTDTEFNLFDCYEVKSIISCLRVINNPRSDTDVLAALMCPVFGFTPDELIDIKDIYAKGLFKRLRRLRLLYEEQNKEAEKIPAEETDIEEETASADEKEPIHIDEALAEKVGKFIDLIDEFRYLAVTYPADRLVQLFMEKTDYQSVMSAMSDGELRVQNLRRFLGYISDLESSSACGLTGVVRNIRYLEDSGKGMMVSDSASVNAVKIMTIHHSKGLEFPICILANTNNKGQSDNDKIKFHDEYGIGMRCVEDGSGLKYNTLQFDFIKSIKDKEEKSELIRLLYVALTRPKEKLIILASVNNKPDKDGVSGYNKYLNDLAEKVVYDDITGRLSPVTIELCNTFEDWIVACALLNKDMAELRMDAGVSDDPLEMNYLPALPCETKWKKKKKKSFEKVSEKETGEYEDETDDDLIDFLGKRFEPVPVDVGTIIPSKVTASALTHDSVNTVFAASKTPDFEKSEEVSAAIRGTAAHEFVQYAELTKLGTDEGISSEIDRVVKEGMMTTDEAALIDIEKIRTFAESSICSRMINSSNVLREMQFTVSIPAEMAVDLPDGKDYTKPDKDSESILQGAMDCIFEEPDGFVIVDYKTDSVQNLNELAKRYSKQLSLYREAANRLFDKKVKECIIYSFCCGCEIKIP